MNTEITYTTVDTDALDFLKAIYFGVTTNAYEAAGRRAYLDLNRTIRFNGMAEEKRNELRASVIALLEKEIRLLSPSTITNQADYDAWHRVQCTAIRSLYRDNDIEFYYGQSQKWLNMMIKYLYMLGECTFDGIFGFLHVPLDNYVFDAAQKKLGISRPKNPWSRWDDYTVQYETYQNELRSKIHEYPPLRWEFKYWMKEARQHTTDWNGST